MRWLLNMLVIKALCIFPLWGAIHYMPASNSSPEDPRELYMDLMKKSVANTIYLDAYETAWSSKLNREQLRKKGRDWPSVAHTMIGIQRLENIQTCLCDILEKGIPGDCVETGVWRGGATIFMRAILKAYQAKDRRVWVADSFAGLPRPDVEQYPLDVFSDHYMNSYLSVSLKTVQNNFQRYGLLDDQVVFLEGWFKDTLPTAPIEKIALLRLDGDLYESTMDALVHLYDKVSVGGYIIVDDYHDIVACKAAVHDFREARGIVDTILEIDGAGIYWQKN